ncbi:MAG: cytochrome C assembly family protein [Methylococcales bacterium]
MAYSNLFGISSILGYVIASGLVLRSIFDEHPEVVQQKPKPLYLLLPAGISGLLHAASLMEDFGNDKGMNFSFMSTASLVILLIVIILFTTAPDKPVEKLAVVIFPLAALVQILKLSLPEQIHFIRAFSFGLNLHILSSILAYSILNIAAIQAVLLAFQDRQLHRHGSNPFIGSFPPLQTMEALLFQMIGAGLILLTISLISGLLFVQDLFAQHLAHKTILSILAWILFSVLLIGRVIFGWRGQTAGRWTLGGFISLMLAYFGSKMVLEIFLHKTWIF